MRNTNSISSPPQELLNRKEEVQQFLIEFFKKTQIIDKIFSLWQDNKTVQISTGVSAEKADEITEQFASVGLKVIRKQALEILPLEIKKQTVNTLENCPVCNTRLENPRLSHCTRCKFSLKETNPNIIHNKRIEWEERMSIAYRQQQDFKKELEDKRKQSEEALRKRIRKELEEKYKKKTWLNTPYGKAAVGGSALLLCGTVFAGGFYWGQSLLKEENQAQAAQSAQSKIMAQMAISESDPVDAFIERLATADGTTNTSENSLVFVSNQTQNAALTTTGQPEKMAQSDQTTQANNHYLLPENQRRALWPVYVDFLLSIEQISRAEEVAQYWRNQKADQQTLTQINAHIFAQHFAYAGLQSDQQELQEHIKRLPTEEKIDALLYAAKALAIRGEWLERFLDDANTQLESVQDTNKKAVWREKMALARAEVLTIRAKRYAQKGLWGEVGRMASELRQLSNIQLNDHTAVAIHLVAYSAYELAHNQEMLNTAQQKVMALNPAQLLENDSNHLLSAWEAHAFELSNELNHYLLSRVFLPQGSAKPVLDSQALRIWRICHQLDFKKERDDLTRYLDSQTGERQETLRAQQHIYQQIDKAQALYRINSYAGVESYVRSLAADFLGKTEK